jgi:hypothetical protein
VGNSIEAVSSDSEIKFAEWQRTAMRVEAEKKFGQNHQALQSLVVSSLSLDGRNKSQPM